MGYCMDQGITKFRIKRENANDAFEAIKKIVATHKLPWINSTSVFDAKTFDEAMLKCRWDVYWDSNEKYIDDICFLGEKLGDDFLIFKAIAPYVEDGSYIQMSGEDGYVWRWLFKNGDVTEEEGIITFKSERDDKELVRFMVEAFKEGTLYGLDIANGPVVPVSEMQNYMEKKIAEILKGE